MISPHAHHDSVWQVFWIFLKLGLTSFGGPIAHLGYFHQAFVVQRRWVSEAEYADLVALCQFLPGPTSSQVGLALGYGQAGYRGALAAWLGFTLPSALILLGFALGLSHSESWLSSGLIHGLKIVAVAVVAQAVWGMARQLCPDVARINLMLTACAAVLLLQGIWVSLLVIVIAALFGLLFFSNKVAATQSTVVTAVVQIPTKKGRLVAALFLLLFVVLLFGLPLLQQYSPSLTLAMFDAFYRSGALVFGGGHVVLPLLQAEVVQSGWVSADHFLAGYALAQAVPGPLFSFAAYLGASMQSAPTGIWGAAIALIAIFLPAFLVLFAVLPFWQSLRQQAQVQAALMAVNAAVVGILLAALYQPIWSSSIFTPLDFCLALFFFIALKFWTLPPWLLVLVAAALGWLFL